MLLLFATAALALADDADDVVVVTATRSEERLADAPVATEVVTREEIEASGARTVDGVLDQHPGIAVTRGVGGAGVQLWGLDPELTLILLDGQPLVGRVGGVLDLSRIATRDLERIEIVKGAGATLYGADALGGVINLITRRAARGVSTTAGARAGRYPTTQAEVSTETGTGGLPWLATSPVQTADADVALSLGGDHWSGRSSAVAQARPTLRSPDGTGSVQSGFSLVTLAQDLAWTPRADRSTRGRVSYTRRLSGGTDVQATGAVLDRTNDTEVVSVRVGPDLRFGDAGSLRATVSYDLFRDQYLADQRAATALDVYEETRDQAGEVDLGGVVAVGSHALTVGTEARFEHIATDRISVPEADRTRLAVYAQDAWDVPVGRPTTVVAGVRFDRDSLFGSAWSPRVAVRHDPVDAVILRASWGRGFRAPPFKDLYLRFENLSSGYRVVGNPALRPELGDSYTASATWLAAPDGRLELRAAVFFNDLRDLIQATLLEPAAAGEPARYSYENVAEAWTRGVEAGLVTRPLDWWGLKADVMLLESRDLDEGRPLQGRAPVTLTGTSSLGYPRGALRCDVRARWRSEAPFFVQEGDTVRERISPSRTVLDGTVQWWPLPALGLSAGVDNLLDSGDPELSPVPPRWVWVALDGRFSRAPSRDLPVEES